MKHEIVIWSKKKSGGGYCIESHITVDEVEIGEFGLQEYEKNHDLDSDRDYWGELEKTIHDK